MSRFEEQLKNATQTVSLTKEERVLLRDRLDRYSDFVVVREDVQSTEPSFFHEMATVFRKRYAAATLGLAIVASSAGVTWAAESSVPGETLYGMKVHFNEEVISAFLSDIAKTNWEVRRAERRLEEASALASRGDLTAETRAQVTEQLEEHINKITQADDVAGDLDALAVVEATQQLEDALEAHEVILVSLSADEIEGESEGQALAGTLRQSAKVVALARADAEEIILIALESDDAVGDDTASSSALNEELMTDEERREVAQQMRKRAHEAERRMNARLTRADLLETPYDDDEAARRLARVQALLDEADTLYGNSEYRASYEKYRQAEEIAKKLMSFLDAADEYDVDALGADIWPADDSDTSVAAESDQAILTTDLLEELTERVITTNVAETEVYPQVQAAHRRAKTLIVRAHVAEQQGDLADAQSFYEAAQLITEEALAQVSLVTEEPVATEPEVTVDEEPAQPVTKPTTPTTSSAAIVPADTEVVIKRQRSGTSQTLSGWLPVIPGCYTYASRLEQTPEKTFILAITAVKLTSCNVTVDQLPFTVEIDDLVIEIETVTVNKQPYPFVIEEADDLDDTLLLEAGQTYQASGYPATKALLEQVLEEVINKAK